MQSVLWDMMRADQLLGEDETRRDSGFDKRTESINLYGQVFAIHHISKEQFRESFSFYRTHPALFKAVMDSLSVPRTEAPTEMIKQPILRDSFQLSPRKGAPPDTVIPLRKKKVFSLN